MQEAVPDTPVEVRYKTERRLIQAGWAAFVVSLFLPMLNDASGILGFVYSLIFLLQIFAKPNWAGFYMSSFALVNLGMLGAILMPMGLKGMTRRWVSIFYVLVMCDTISIAFTMEREFLRNPAFWVWCGASILIAAGVVKARMAYLKEQAQA
ncbi:MAG: hypothetical protein GAK35_01084 [Herbaspirillum frisingense]|uniref:Uncharacterized protein n=1 Tax=Herbaspirillum frisingense TaxID=92645 RepID=A0A7V8FYW2_9BURK|nr:MAG: hypothetical protein GAK35_01084 [Herbaspirillum frisingense]